MTRQQACLERSGGLCELCGADGTLAPYPVPGATAGEDETSMICCGCRHPITADGTALQGGDTVNLIKNLKVKGAGFSAKGGTAVREISLSDNPQQIAGRVKGTRIVLLARLFKKTG